MGRLPRFFPNQRLILSERSDSHDRAFPAEPSFRYNDLMIQSLRLPSSERGRPGETNLLRDRIWRVAPPFTCTVLGTARRKCHFGTLRSKPALRMKFLCQIQLPALKAAPQIVSPRAHCRNDRHAFEAIARGNPFCLFQIGRA